MNKEIHEDVEVIPPGVISESARRERTKFTFMPRFVRNMPQD